jgi:hypothetical protein
MIRDGRSSPPHNPGLLGTARLSSSPEKASRKGGFLLDDHRSLLLHGPNCSSKTDACLGRMRNHSMHPHRLAVSVLLCLAGISGLDVVAQTSPSSSPSYPLPAVAVTGSTRFRDADLVKATGLKTGSMVTADDFKQAGDRLSQTGLFSQVGYRFDGKVATYTVVDADALLPISFENFVWFSDAELSKKLQAAVPLFSGTVPPSGTVTDQVAAALHQLLKGKGSTKPCGGRASAFRRQGFGHPVSRRWR